MGQLPGGHSIYLTVQLSRQVRVTKCVGLNTYITYPLSKITNYWEFLLEINSTIGLFKNCLSPKKSFYKTERGEKNTEENSTEEGQGLLNDVHANFTRPTYSSLTRTHQNLTISLLTYPISCYAEGC